MKLLFMILLFMASLSATTLKQAWEEAEPGEGYEKYVVLNTGEVYTYGLVLDVFESSSLSTKIVGNGAVLNLKKEKILADGIDGKDFSIEDCVIINGSVEYHGWASGVEPTGTIKNVTFYKPLGYGLRVQWCGSDITVENCIFESAQWSGGSGSEPDGINVAFSSLEGYGIPKLYNNWSYHPEEPLDSYSVHFSRL